jgi:hypothetical protein
MSPQWLMLVCDVQPRAPKDTFDGQIFKRVIESEGDDPYGAFINL